ncbi:4-oxalocrotonate tautomerase family protein [Streptomyces sp. NPDC086777]|uniref:4-oxalocrotonate tautomerase family protein n=1 Tax=Streptomyces sp. NPDC086777 TaxID=3154866 RepID=UPI00344F04BA
MPSADCGPVGAGRTVPPPGRRPGAPPAPLRGRRQPRRTSRSGPDSGQDPERTTHAEEFSDADRHRPAGPRDPELERDLVRRVTDAFVDAYKIPAETVQVWIHEVPADSWGTAGKLAADRWAPVWIGGAAGCSW